MHSAFNAIAVANDPYRNTPGTGDFGKTLPTTYAFMASSNYTQFERCRAPLPQRPSAFPTARWKSDAGAAGANGDGQPAEQVAGLLV